MYSLRRNNFDRTILLKTADGRVFEVREYDNGSNHDLNIKELDGKMFYGSFLYEPNEYEENVFDFFERVDYRARFIGTDDGNGSLGIRTKDYHVRKWEVVEKGTTPTGICINFRHNKDIATFRLDKVADGLRYSLLLGIHSKVEWKTGYRKPKKYEAFMRLAEQVFKKDPKKVLVQVIV